MVLFQKYTENALWPLSIIFNSAKLYTIIIHLTKVVLVHKLNTKFSISMQIWSECSFFRSVFHWTKRWAKWKLLVLCPLPFQFISAHQCDENEAVKCCDEFSRRGSYAFFSVSPFDFLHFSLHGSVPSLAFSIFLYLTFDKIICCFMVFLQFFTVCFWEFCLP